MSKITKWEILPPYADEPLLPLIGFTDDNGASYTIVAQLKTSHRAEQIVAAMNAAEVKATPTATITLELSFEQLSILTQAMQNEQYRCSHTMVNQTYAHKVNALANGIARRYDAEVFGMVNAPALPRHCPHGVSMRGPDRCSECDETSGNVTR
jgi:hypothetical protein